jgi:NaMN:DMB phosphoribosyltransferase
MVHLSFDTQIRIGDLIFGGSTAALGYGIRKAYHVVVRFVSRVNDNEDELKATSKMVDRHSRALLKAALIGPPVERVHQNRRHTDPVLIDTRDDEVRI